MLKNNTIYLKQTFRIGIYYYEIILRNNMIPKSEIFSHKACILVNYLVQHCDMPLRTLDRPGWSSAIGVDDPRRHRSKIEVFIIMNYYDTHHKDLLDLMNKYETKRINTVHNETL